MKAISESLIAREVAVVLIKSIVVNNANPVAKRPEYRSPPIKTHLGIPVGGPYVMTASSKVRKASGDVAFVMIVVSKSEWFAFSKSSNEARTEFSESVEFEEEGTPSREIL